MVTLASTKYRYGKHGEQNIHLKSLENLEVMNCWAQSHRAKAETKAMSCHLLSFMFVIYSLIFLLVIWSLSLGVNGPLEIITPASQARDQSLAAPRISSTLHTRSHGSSLPPSSKPFIYYKIKHTSQIDLLSNLTTGIAAARLSKQGVATDVLSNKNAFQ